MKREIGLATLYLGDALDTMEQLEAGDAIITDPPYCSGSVGEAQRTAAKGQGLRSENIRRLGWFVGDNMGTAGLTFLLRSMAFRGREILNPEGSVLVFCDWRMVPNLAPAIGELRAFVIRTWSFGTKGTWEWAKAFRAQHEIILHYTAGSPKYHDLGTPNVIKAGRVSADDREHQTQKPIDLMEKLVRVVSPPEGVVLDPFMGSGATGCAAIKAGRKFIGIERDPEHFETACRRIAEASGNAGPLFGEAA